MTAKLFVASQIRSNIIRRAAITFRRLDISRINDLSRTQLLREIKLLLDHIDHRYVRSSKTQAGLQCHKANCSAAKNNNVASQLSATENRRMHTNCRRFNQSCLKRTHTFRNVIGPRFRMSHILRIRSLEVRSSSQEINIRADIVVTGAAILAGIIRYAGLNQNFIADLEFCDLRTNLDDFSCNLMAKSDFLARLRFLIGTEFKSMNIGSTHTDVFDFHKNLVCLRLRDRAFFNFKLLWMNKDCL